MQEIVLRQATHIKEPMKHGLNRQLTLDSNRFFEPGIRNGRDLPPFTAFFISHFRQNRKRLHRDGCDQFRAHFAAMAKNCRRLRFARLN